MLSRQYSSAARYFHIGMYLVHNGVGTCSLPFWFGRGRTLARAMMRTLATEANIEEDRVEGMSEKKTYRAYAIGILISMAVIGVYLIWAVITDRPPAKHTPYAGPAVTTPIATSVSTRR